MPSPYKVRDVGEMYCPHGCPDGECRPQAVEMYWELGCWWGYGACERCGEELQYDMPRPKEEDDDE